MPSIEVGLREGVSRTTRCLTGMTGVDDILGGGLPRGRPILVAGDTGAGKTVFCLQTLLNGAVQFGEPGLYLSFEEREVDLRTAVDAFAWGGVPADLHFHDALVGHRFEADGDFDLLGLIGILDHLCDKYGIRRLVLDGIDQLLGSSDQPNHVRREISRLLDWIRERDRTCLITAKTKEQAGRFSDAYEHLLFQVDGVILLQQEMLHRTAQRTLRVVKLRGSEHGDNAYPTVITEQGIAALYLPPQRPVDGAPARATTARVSTGVGDLDEMLLGGLIAGTTTLITGSPGTAKTTLAGCFVAAACARGERALFVLFDEYPERVVSNLQSVGLDLRTCVDSGLLRMEHRVSSTAGPDSHVAAIRGWMEEHDPTCAAIDPLSALIKGRTDDSAATSIEHLVQSMRARGTTAMLTSLIEQEGREASEAHISTVADSWVHLDYGIRRGERNRTLTIVKARGIGHSNQVREMLLSDRGIALADVYPIEGGMLVGSSRLMQQQSDNVQRLATNAAHDIAAQHAAQKRLALLDTMARLQDELRQVESSEAAPFGTDTRGERS